MSVEKIIQELNTIIDNTNLNIETSEAGTVSKVYDGIATVYGLANVKSMEMLEFASGAKGIAFNLESDNVGVVIIDGADKISEGERVKSTGKILSVSVSEKLLGRVIDPLMNIIDGGEDLKSGDVKEMLVERVAPGVMTREPVTVPMQTGIKAIDAMIPVGRGQRELIIGDRQTGKTTIAVDTIINQKGKDVICVYVAIGQKENRSDSREIKRRGSSRLYSYRSRWSFSWSCKIISISLCRSCYI